MPVRFKSTRGDGLVSFEEALLQGLAPDGGLYIPTTIPRLPSGISRGATISGSRSRASRRAIISGRPSGDAGNATFADLGVEVLNGWLGDEIEHDVLSRLVHDALNFDVPLVPLEGRGWEDVYVLELFHGPTLSFKDFGARTMARLMGHFLDRRGEDLTILVATSGDTGSAVADGFAGIEHIDVVLLYPKGKVSPTQERQLIVRRSGVRAFAVDGDFDDCQRMVKEAFVDPELADAHLSSANSINIGRLLPQMLYYIEAGGRLETDTVRFCVPSGNLGNLTAGVLAHLSGLPVRGFIAAHNANDFFPQVLQGEDAHAAPTIRTLSNAMDVGAPSNFERLDALLPRRRMRELIQGTSVNDEETITSMRRVYETTGYLTDPHTSVGLEAVRRAREQDRAAGPFVVLSTAHPAKFPEVVEDALGVTSAVPHRLAELAERETAVEDIQPTLEALRDRITSDCA